MSDTPATVRHKRGISKIWIIPLVALALGLWMLMYNFTHQGPTFEITFENADDLVAGKTKIKLLSVDIGVVNSIELKSDVSGVIVNAALEKQYADLLKEDTQFWVERARVGTSGVSGLNTLLSGAHIKVLPGNSKIEQTSFNGLETPPLTDANAPGVRLVLESKNASSISTGDDVLFNGYKVGGVESMVLDEDSQTVKYDVFIKAPFHHLVTENVRFWDISGVSMRASARGFDVDMGSLDTLLTGGLSFSLPSHLSPGSAVKDSTHFKLYGSREETLERHYHQKIYYVVAFKQPVGGLSPGSPVTYRGIPVGQVEKVLLKEMMAQAPHQTGAPIPVLIYLEPARFEVGDSDESSDRLKQMILAGIDNGLRATLKTGNLISGSQLVNLDFYPNEPAAETGTFNQYAQIPTMAGGIDQIQQSLTALLDKFNNLPLDTTVGNANNAIHQLDQTLLKVDSLLSTPQVQTLPDQINSSLTELDSTLKNFQELSDSLRNSAQLLPVSEHTDIIPEAKQE
ncbi:intermembrane transport protein PqiB [Pseudomaricurvus sp.]|uniref:intermembrane transport protein PqiB n=1 Tax=Pseudomaricurvus sp. TaxID=2004510 RepID=UPI003F6A8299